MKLILGVVFILALVGSCAKKYGCNNKSALNYKPGSYTGYKYDDNSCVFAVDLELCLREKDYQKLLDSGIVYYNVYFDDEFIGADSVSHYLPTNGKLENFDGIKYYDTINWIRKPVLLKLFDQNNVLFKSYEFNLSGGGISSHYLSQ